MSKREVAREETRARIVDATVKLHSENGVFGTSWKQIADQADVSVATMYAHFPSLEELLPACGELVIERVRPPRPDSAAQIIGDAEGVAERLERVVRELFEFYERGGTSIEVDVRERRLPGMREWEDYLLDAVAAFVREALGRRADTHTVRLVSALIDLPTFRALRTRGIGVSRAVETMARVAADVVDRAERKRKR